MIILWQFLNFRSARFNGCSNTMVLHLKLGKHVWIPENQVTDERKAEMGKRKELDIWNHLSETFGVQKCFVI